MELKKTIIDEYLNCEEVRDFFMKQSSFCNIGLPKYFDFQNLLNALQLNLKNKIFARGWKKDFYSDVIIEEDKHPKKQNSVNYLFFRNKDGRFDWRPMQIINPVIYTFLVNWITDEKNWKIIKNRFYAFAKNDNQNIQCFSLPLYNPKGKHGDTSDSILNWWSNIEQKTLEYAMTYNYLLTTDITDCYGSIYTHSITWAMCKNGKEEAKDMLAGNKNKSDEYLIGDQIDKYIEAMSNQQTNGIPQGSVLMDFIAELVLGYADLKLSKKIISLDLSKDENIKNDYKILRYRDDYRIFGRTQEDVIKIAKELSIILSELNFKLNTSKTTITQDIICGALKPDKLYYITKDFKRLEDKKSGYTLQKQLLRIYKLSLECPNSGMLQKSFEFFFKRLCEDNCTDLFKEAGASKVLISIVTNIAYNNPKVYKTAIAIIGKILSYDTTENAQKIYKEIINKFKELPNVGYLEIWLQRLTIKSQRTNEYAENLCKYAANPTDVNMIWNIGWLKEEIQGIFTDKSNSIIKESEIERMSNTIEYEEIETFSRY